MTMIEKVAKAIRLRDTTDEFAMARAAIEAMREPTKEMIEAGEREFFEHFPEAREWTLVGTKDAYEEMILAALANG